MYVLVLSMLVVTLNNGEVTGKWSDEYLYPYTRGAIIFSSLERCDALYDSLNKDGLKGKCVQIDIK